MASGQFALSGFGPLPSHDEIATSLTREIPLYAVLSESEPQAFRDIVEIFREGAFEGQPEGQVLSRARFIISNLVSKYAPLATDGALLAMAAVIVEEIEAIGARDKIACYKFLFPEKDQSFDIRNYISPELQTRDLQAVESIILTGLNGSSYEISQEKIDDLIIKLFDVIEKNHDEKLVEDFILFSTDNSSISKSRKCDLIYVIFREILMMERNESIYLLRFMMFE